MNKTSMEKIGYNEFYKDEFKEIVARESGMIPGRVSAVHRERYQVITEHGESWATLKGSIFYNSPESVIYPTTGDFVAVRHNPVGEDIIYKVLKRKSEFSRMDSFNRNKQVVAANFDYVLILSSMNKDFNIKRLDRYIVSAWESGAEPLVVLTKSDISDDFSMYVDAIESNSPGVKVFPVSSITGAGIEALKDYLKSESTLVLLGSSGVGKSSLVNALAESEVMKVNTIRENDAKGKHTTTHRQLIVLDDGTMVIDTPGMRELELWSADSGMEEAFHDIAAIADRCRFRDCSHNDEPGCAIRYALKSGELANSRWNNYLKLKKESEYARAKEEKSARVQKKAQEKKFGKMQKDFKKSKKTY
ncbi:ribosome small subunit-dependent GTPase A [Gudongella sp. DL1XJH-153]|uniref:ribosome small subunit-dependent GTPase A n=1 Tax=Gudongella sp. DL1XJH-153 TaxID=3409804 RepID=UPI003BB558BF